jgi:uncharacterized protein (TIGR02466 family)
MNRHQRRQAKKLGIAGASQLGEHESLKSLAFSHLQSGRLTDAEALYTRTLAIDPSDPDVIHFLGIIAYRTGRYDLAIKRLTAATRLAPDYAEAHNNLGLLLLEQQKADEAISHFERAVSLKPNYAAAYANLGHAARQSGRPGDAIASYQRAVQINPDHKGAYYGLASALLSHGNLAATMDACDKCLQLDPLCQHAPAYQSIAQYGLNKKEDAKRLTDFTTMIRKAQIGTPPGFDDAVSFNEALVADIRAHPTLIWEPHDRVTRGGAVTRDLLETPNPTIMCLERALRVAINEFTESLPFDASHPFFGTTPKTYTLTLIASVLKAGGHHPSHIHEGAWLSGVYYASVPSVVSGHDGDHPGWLEFGRPDCDPPLDCELQVGAVAPEAGTVVMFPSYFFHHTIPYQGFEERIGVAFDAYRLP